MRSRIVFASAALALAACGNPTPPSAPAAFDRPQDVAFFCWGFGERNAVELGDCAPPDADALEEGAAPDRYALHGLVTQTTTGEVAAVRITGDQGEPGVIDTDVRIPGFTFAAVGEVPSGLAVDPDDPKQVYVTSRGSSELHTVGLSSLRESASGAAVSLFPDLPPASRPSATVLAGGSLWVALPGTGQLARVALDPMEGTPTGSELIDLRSDVPDPVDLTLLSEEQLPPDYLYTCPADLVRFLPPIVPPRAPRSRGGAPEPWSFAVDDSDPDAPILLVADRSLPVVHRIRIEGDTATELTPITTSVPVRDLALTPFVPAQDGGTDPTERYLYAIDELDRSVLVVDYPTDEADPTFGAVLPAQVVEPFDRLALPFLARDLEVATPGYDPASGLVECSDAASGEDASGTDLRGVFLTVARSDGALAFFDVFDLDTRCRGTAACGATGARLAADDLVVAIGRHRPRIGTALEQEVQVEPAPQWETGGGTFDVASAGGSSAPATTPALLPLTCEAPLQQVFPSPSSEMSPIVCAVADPWAAVNQSWTVAYEGTVPFTSSSGANLAAPAEGAETMTLESRTDFCARGVIGAEDVPGDGYLSGYAGDLLAITSDLPPSVLMESEQLVARCGDDLRDRCVELTARTTAGTITPLLLPILRAESRPVADPVADSYVGRLTLGAPLGSDATLAEVECCYPELAEVEVRAREAFVVSSSIRPGFVHPIVRSDEGRCEVDPDLVAQGRRGRAFFDEVYQTPLVSFALGSAPPNIGTPVLSFTIGEVPRPLTVDVSSVGGTNGASLLTRVIYNDVDQRLYAVDQAVQGLMRLRLRAPGLTIQQTFR